MMSQKFKKNRKQRIILAILNNKMEVINPILKNNKSQVIILFIQYKGTNLLVSDNFIGKFDIYNLKIPQKLSLVLKMKINKITQKIVIKFHFNNFNKCNQTRKTCSQLKTIPNKWHFCPKIPNSNNNIYNISINIKINSPNNH